VGVCQQHQAANKITEDGEGGLEDAQFRISDVPYPNMARSHTKVHLRKWLETHHNVSAPLAPVQKIPNFLEELSYKSPRGVTKGRDGIIKDTCAMSLAHAPATRRCHACHHHGILGW